MIGYHITSIDTYIKHVSKEGLIPNLGDRSFMIEERENRTYFFSTINALEDGIMNWLGDELESFGISEIAILKVDLSNINVKKTFNENSWEFYTTEFIPPENIELIRYESLIEESITRKRIKLLLENNINNTLNEASESRDQKYRKLAKSIVNKIKNNIDSINWKMCGKEMGQELSSPISGYTHSFYYGIEFELDTIVPSFPVTVAFIHGYDYMINIAAYKISPINIIYVKLFDDIDDVKLMLQNIESYKQPKGINNKKYEVETYKRLLKRHWNMEIEDALFHELIHYIDHNKRNIPMDSRSSYYSIGKDYYKSPHEFNAYYQQAINTIKNKKKYYGMSFQQFINALLDDDVFQPHFISKIFEDETYKKKIEKRLYNWYVKNIQGK